MKITLCDKNLKNDIPLLEFNNANDGIGFVYDWLGTKNFDKSVFVCFPTWGDEDINYPRDVHNSILVSHNWEDITDYVDMYLDEDYEDFPLFSIYEFNTYKEAFEYCLMLNEF